MPLVDRLHRLVQNTIYAVLDDDFAVARFDVNIACAALNGVENRRIDEFDDRTGVGRDPIDRKHLAAVAIVLNQLQTKILGGVIQNSLSALRLLEHIFDRGAGSDLEVDRSAEQKFDLVDSSYVCRIRDHDGDSVIFSTLRNEAVTKHYVEGNRPEEVIVDGEPIMGNELEIVAAGKFGRPLLVARTLG